MINNAYPEFMRQVGAFSWTRAGYSFAAPDDVDLLSERALSAENPWIVVAAVLARAKENDHSKVGILERFAFDEKHIPLHRVSILLVGDIAPDEQLSMLIDLMRSGDEDRSIYAALAAERANSLRLVPAMLECWHNTVTLNGRELVGFAISSLLEDPPGDISNSAGSYSLAAEQVGTAPPGFERFSTPRAGRTASDTFDDLVRQRYSALKASVENENVAILEGKKFGVREFALQLRGRIPAIAADIGLWDLMPNYRQKLEATTGVDCSRFFENDRFNALGAASVVEDFLDSGAAAAYQAGVRYFWGHRIQ